MRPAYWELHTRGGGAKSAIVLGRKFCPGCGHWRHVCDYSPHRYKLRSRCHGCQRAYQRGWRRTATEEQRERMREYERIRAEALRRARGAARNRPRRGPLPVERVYFPSQPLLALITDALRRDRFDGWEAIGRAAGLSPKTLLRLRTGESARVTIDSADRLAMALGVPLALIYPEDPGVQDAI